jgi:cytoskeletal protein CcmA (bactofilin family)
MSSSVIKKIMNKFLTENIYFPDINDRLIQVESIDELNSDLDYLSDKINFDKKNFLNRLLVFMDKEKNDEFLTSNLVKIEDISLDLSFFDEDRDDKIEKKDFDYLISEIENLVNINNILIIEPEEKIIDIFEQEAQQELNKEHEEKNFNNILGLKNKNQNVVFVEGDIIDQVTVIGINTKIISGVIISKNDVEIYGEFHGDLNCLNLYVGEAGFVEGNIRAKTINLFGMMKGKVSTEIMKTNEDSIFGGELLCSSYNSEPGARFEGSLTLGVAKELLMLDTKEENEDLET